MTALFYAVFLNQSTDINIETNEVHGIKYIVLGANQDEYIYIYNLFHSNWFNN